MWPNQGTNGVRIGIAGTNTSITLNDQHSTTRFKFNSSAPTASGTAGVLGRESATQIVGYSTKTIDDLDKNISNADLTSDGNHTLNVSGFDLSITDADDFQVGATNGILFFAPTFTHSAPVPSVGLFRINHTSTSTNNYSFVGGNTIASGTDAVMFRVAGDSGSGGEVRYDPSITHSFLSAAGQNISNADLTFDGNHTTDGDNFEFNLTNFDEINFGALSMLIQADNGMYLNSAGSAVVVINNNSTTTNRYVFENNRILPNTNAAVMFREAGSDGNAGHVRYDFDITYADIASAIAGGGQNFANADLTFTGDRTHDVDFNTLLITNSLDTAWYLSTNVFIRTGINEHGVPTPGWFELNVSRLLAQPFDTANGARIEGFQDEDANQAFIRMRAGYYGSGVEVYHEKDDETEDYLYLWSNQKIYFETPNVYSNIALAGQALVSLDLDGAIEYASIYYKGLATGTPGTWVADTATLVPAYNDGAQPPEGTIAYLKFNANSVGSDTLQLGDSTTGIAITRANGVAIEADDITAGQYIMLVRAGTSSGSHWVCESCGASGVAPAAGSVVAIDTASDLASEVAAIAITQGYTTVGDGGHGAYRADSLSSETINNVTVFDRTAGGRYLLMTSGSISAKQAGAVGDGSTDDHDALQALFDVCVNMAARIEPLEYLSTGGLTVPAGVRVIAYGATITCDTSGNDDRAIDLESNTKWEGGTVVDHRVSGGDSGEDHVAFRIGHYTDGVGQSNIVIKNVTISTDWASDLANGMIITGNSHDITLDGIRCEDSSTMRTVIANHWGYIVDGDETSGTLHPYNINISNVNVGELTAATGDVTPVSVAACYNVNVNNVRSKRARYGFSYTCGDFGYRYSGFQGLTMGSVNVNNLTCERGYNAGILIVGVDSNGDVWPLEGSFNNFTLIGSNDATGQAGIFLQSVLGTTFRSGVISGFEQGTLITNATKNIAFYDTLFTTNRLGGFVYNDAASSNAIVSHCKFHNNGWGLSGTNAAAILLVDGSNIRIENNEIGDQETEANQEVGISLSAGVDNVSMFGNYVLNVKSGGVNYAYNLGDTADGTSVALFENNLAAPGILITDAAPNLIVKATDGAGTDKAGGAASLRGGLSTGTGAGGPVTTATSLSGSTGTTLNAYSTRSYIAAKPTDLTEASATTFCNVALPAAGYVGLRIATTVFASDGTDHQVSHVPITFSAVNKAGTITISSITVPTATVAVSSGTLTPVTFTAVQNGNSIDVKCAATSSLTQTVLRIKWAIVELNSNGEAAITAL